MHKCIDAIVGVYGVRIVHHGGIARAARALDAYAQAHAVPSMGGLRNARGRIMELDRNDGRARIQDKYVS